jgi:DNA-binding winged helix-turn-helix (wHTH) protein/tetratricopeptide (TPR) repeat protein
MELLRFGPFELDPAAEELRRAGLVVRLPRQPLRILLLLVRRAGEVVSRDEIHEAIWGSETYVDYEHGINSAIRQIRYALGDHAGTPRYIRTLPRRGYSFVAPVERVAHPLEGRALSPAVVEPVRRAESPAVQKDAGRRRITPRIAVIAAMIVMAITAMAAIVTRRSVESRKNSAREIAVLAFRRLGPAITGFDERAFAEELRAKIGTLRRTHVSLVDAAARTRADVIVDGTIRQSEDGIRVIVSVADAKTQTQLWSETFLRPDKRKEGMAVEVAHRVMCELARRYVPAARHEPPLKTRAAPPVIAQYRRARLAHNRSQAYDWMRTKGLYEAALRDEPKFAEAWSGLSDVWANQMLFGPMAERGEAARQAENCAKRAVALQPANPEAHSILGVIAAQRDYDLATAEDAIRRAIAADPGYADGRTNLAMILAMRGQGEEALREFATAQQLDPIALDISPIGPLLHLHARRYEDARARYREILAVNPDSQAAAWGVLFTYIAQQNWAEAIAFARKLRPGDGAPATREGFLQVYRSFEDFVLDGRRRGVFNDYFLALYYAQLGEKDRAFALLDQAIDSRIPVVSYIMVDPRLDALRGDPRFNALVARMKLGRPPSS